jgi:plasmid stability protein
MRDIKLVSSGRVAAFHLRNIPDRLYRRLKARAKRNGRSVNAELIEILEFELDRPSPEELNAELARLQSSIRLRPGAPTPEELIRHDRDTR